MIGSLTVRRSLLLRPQLEAVVAIRSYQVYKVKRWQYHFDKLAWRQYKTPPALAQKERNLDQYLEWTKTDEERVKELERYRISSRHLAAMMGEDPKTFTYDDQQRAIKYLMPGYAMYAEANPKLEHPQEWMGPYKNP